MDTAEYETNALLINNISSIAFAFYEPVLPPADFFGLGALELEGALRHDGSLVHYDSIRRGLWLFRLHRKDSQQETPSFAKSLEGAGYGLSLIEEGAFEPASLAKNRGFGPNAVNTPSSSSSSTSNPLDIAFRGPPSATLPGSAVDQDSKILPVPDVKASTSTTNKEAHDHFISSVLSSITSAFCSKTGATPLSSRTLLLPQHVQGESAIPVPVLASLRVYLTTTGSLVILVSLSQVEGLITLSENIPLPPLGITVLAAPLGLFATCNELADGEYSTIHSALAQSPDTQVSRIRPEKETGPWRHMCTKILRARNLPSPISGTQKWLSLQRVRRKPNEQLYDGKRTPMINSPSNISWPSSLCFAKGFSKLSIGTNLLELPSSSSDTASDPLAAAKSWFLDAGERDKELIKRKDEREAASAQENCPVDGQASQANGLSPMTLQRPNQTGAPTSAVYPTPPDGIQNVVGITPSIDGTVSSPSNNASTKAMVDIDTTMNLPSDAIHDGWDNPETKRERNGGSFESENLFGDLGPDMFGGDNDITDADFSFFDEHPGGMDLSLDVADMTNTDSLLEIPSSLPNPSFPPIKAEPVEPPPPSVPAAPVFAKPELKHARSSLNEQPRRQTEPDIGVLRPTTAKRQASPFNPDTVFKRIKASLESRSAVYQKPRVKTAQLGSIFDKVEFGPGLSLVNHKYQGEGRFSFSLDKASESKPVTFNAPPTTDYLQRHGKGRKLLKDPPANVGELFARVTNGQGMSSQYASPTKADDPPSDADEISLVSDQDDSSYESDEPSSPFKTASLRKRRLEDDEQSLTTSSFRELEGLDATSPRISADFPRLSRSDIDLPLTKYFADPEPPSSDITLLDQDFIMAAQIVTEQACTSTLGLATDLELSLQSKLERRRELLTLTHRSVQDLQSVLPHWLGEASDCVFKPFLEVQDMPLLGQPTRMQPRPPGAEQIKPNNPFQLPPPRLEMRRYESKLSVLPTAVSFWESLGLGPSNSGKDVNAVCIFPDTEGSSDDVSAFLDKMQGVYESLKLGSFSRMSASPDIPGGSLLYQVERPSESFDGVASILGTSLVSGLSKLTDVLSHLTVKDTNIVVFFAYSRNVPGSIVRSCYAFQQLYEGYKRLLANGRKTVDNDIVLQLVPMDFVTLSGSLITPTPLDYFRLALETYDRCTLFGGAMPAPSVILEQPLPRMIDFKLSTAPSASLLHENTCLHIAYAQSIDERWITAAWTDNRGSQQMTASYCLGRKNKSIATPRSEVAQEIWETTRDIISSWKVHWRIIITKCGVMEQCEIDLWSSLAQAESRASVTLTLMTVDTNPSLQLIPPEVKIPVNAPAVFYTTPVTTPQPSMVSPEQSGNPPTPSLRENAMSAPSPGATQESDADSTLTDVTEQTWGAILSHRLNNSTSLTELNPAIVSGYLVKRGGIRVEDPPAVMEVNIVHTDGNPRAYETLLREMLTYFRGLGTLARARGMVDREVDVRPWHIAAAEKGVHALYMLM